jgi:hypothetical protein
MTGDDEIAHLQDSGQSSGEPPHLDTTDQVPLQESTKGVTIATLSGVPKYYTFRIRGILQGKRVTTLIDGGATHNFIDVALVTRRHIPAEDFEGFNMVVEDGYNMTCTQRIRGLDVTLGNYTLTDDFYVVDLEDTHVVLGFNGCTHWETSI